MWELDYKEGWVPKNWCPQIAVLKTTLKSPLDSKEIKGDKGDKNFLDIPKGYQSWMFIGRSDAEAEAPVLWPLDSKSQLIGKDAYAGQVWMQEEKKVTEDEMVRWHHQFNGHESEETPEDGE